MNSFLFSAIALCLVAQCALASYQSAPAYGHGYQQQRKMAPSPQVYGQQQQHASVYGPSEQQAYEPAVYEQPAAYKAPSSAAVSQYEERAPASSGYNKQASYGRPSGASYGQAAPAYAKPAPKYEEPYHPPMPFAWGYDINDGYGGAQYHKENGDEYGKRTGSYGYTDAYGIYRQVDYVADEHGFRATIKTNEPGTANESPADVELHAYEPPSNYYAGNSNSYAAPAPKYSAPQSYQPAQASYSAPRQASGYAQSQRASYSQKQAAAYSAPRAYQQHEQSQQYSSSVIVPVYQKPAASPLKVQASQPAKRAY